MENIIELLNNYKYSKELLKYKFKFNINYKSEEIPENVSLSECFTNTLSISNLYREINLNFNNPFFNIINQIFLNNKNNILALYPKISKNEENDIKLYFFFINRIQIRRDLEYDNKNVFFYNNILNECKKLQEMLNKDNNYDILFNVKFNLYRIL